MKPMEKLLLSYSAIREQQKTYALRQSEVPIEHAVSLPIPTKRWGEPGYAFFASPVLRTPGQPLEQSGPDRWWVVMAHGGRLIIYALCEALRFSDQNDWLSVTLPVVNRTIDEMRAALKGIEEMMNQLAPAFFSGKAGDAVARKALHDLLYEHLPEPILPQYRALAPDFFAWLEA